LASLSVVEFAGQWYADILYYNGYKLPLVTTHELDPFLMKWSWGSEEDQLKAKNYNDYAATREIVPTAWVDMTILFRGYEEGQYVPACQHMGLGHDGCQLKRSGGL
jgi:hypothetical protein